MLIQQVNHSKLYTVTNYVFHNVKPKWFIAMAVTVTLICKLVEKYVFDDWTFLGFVFVLVGWDTLLGLIYHARAHTVSSKGFSAIFLKVISYCAFLSITHVATNFTIHDVPNHIFTWIDYFCYSAVVVRECLSVIENIGKLSKSALPTWLIRMFRNFDETGNYLPKEKG